MKLSVFLSLSVLCLWICPCLPQAIKRKVPAKGRAQGIIWDPKNCDKIRSGLEKHLFVHLNGTFTQLRLRDAFPVLMRLLLPLNCTRSAPDPPAQDPPVSTADGEPAPAPVDEELPVYDSRPKRQVFMGPGMLGMLPFMEPGELFPASKGRSPFKDITDRPGGMLNLFNPMLGMMTTEPNNNNQEGNGWPRTLGMMSMAQMMGLAGLQQRQLIQQQQLQRQLQLQQQQQLIAQQQQQPQLKTLQQAGQFRKKRAINSEATAPTPLETQRPSFDTLKESSPTVSRGRSDHLLNPFFPYILKTMFGSHGDGQLPAAFGLPGWNHHHGGVNTAASFDAETSSPVLPPQTQRAAAPLSKTWPVTAHGLVPAEDPAVLAPGSGGMSGRGLLPLPGTAWPFSALPWASGEKAEAKTRVRRASEESSSDQVLTEIVQLGDLTFPADTFVKAVELGLFSDVERSKSE